MDHKTDVETYTMKPLAELTLLDRFLFACAMEDRRTLQLVLSIILDQEILLDEHPQSEKELRTAPWLRSVRLDVYSMDEESRVYNTEVQKRNTGNLIKRSRFYQALIDSSLLAPGEADFNCMPSSYIITILSLIHISDFDFRNRAFHELQIWEVPASIRIEAAPTFVELLEKLTAFFGRQPELPEWVYNGLIIGVQGGNERSFGLLEKTLKKGIKVSALWLSLIHILLAA